MTSVAKGDQVEVWSNSKKAWCTDGVVLEAPHSDCVIDGYAIPAGAVKVTSSAGVKWIMPNQVADVLRKVASNPPDPVSALAVGKEARTPQHFPMTSQGYRNTAPVVKEFPSLLAQIPAGEAKAEARQAASDLSEARFSLKEPADFARFLRGADVRLVRFKYLRLLLLSKRPLPRRQEAQSETFTSDGKTESALVSHEEVESWAKGGTNAIICSISHAWETREHPDPCRFQLQKIVGHASLFQAAFQAEVWVFYDYVSLFQYEREPGHQQNSFGKAMDNMHIMYSHECSMTFRIESLTPEDVWEATKLNEKELIQVFDASSKDVRAKPLKDLVENRTAYLARGWCRAEIEWSSLRRVNAQHQRIDPPDSEEVRAGFWNCRMPMTPAKFRKQMEKAKFTHRSDAESVIHLQEKIFNEKVTVRESLVLDGLAASQVVALAEALPNYQNLKSLKVTRYSCGEAEAKVFGEALSTTNIETLILIPDRAVAECPMPMVQIPEEETGRFMGKAIALALKRNKSIRNINLRGGRMGLEATQALAEALKVNSSVQNINLERNNIGTSGVKALAEALKVNTSIQNINLQVNGVRYDGQEALEAVQQALGRNRRNRSVATNYLEEAQGEQDLEPDQPSGREPFDMPARIEAFALAKDLKANETVYSLSIQFNENRDLCQAIAEIIETNTTVKKIILGCSEIDPEGAQALAEALKVNQAIREVNLDGELGCQAVAEALKTNQTIRKVSLTMNKMGDLGCQALAEALKVNKTICEVGLSSNEIGEPGCQAIAAALEMNTTVEKISLSFNSIGSKGAQVYRRAGHAVRFFKALAEALKVNQTIRKVDLSWNEIGDLGWQALAEALKMNQTICEVRLHGSQMGFEGCQALAEALKTNRTIREICLGHNKIGDLGCQAIAAALEMNTSIEKISLTYNSICSEGAQALAEALKMNRMIRKVNLSNNEIGDLGCQAIAAALKINSTLQKISLARNQIGEGLQALAEALKVNQTICEVGVGENRIYGEATWVKALQEVVEEKKQMGINFELKWIGDLVDW